MNKHFLAILAAIALISTANAQFYGNVSTGRGGQMSFFGGVAFNTAAPLFRYNTTTVDSWGYTYSQWTDVEADKVAPLMGPSFLISMSSLRDYNEKFRMGAMLGIGFTQCQWQADFSAVALHSAYSYTLWSKSNLIDALLGIEGSYRVAEPVSIDFAVAPAFTFVTGNKARTEKRLGANLVPDAEANEWHKAENMHSFSPNIDFGAIARLGASYHFGDNMWAGLSFQYRMTLFNLITATEMSGFSEDGYRRADNDLIYCDVKHNGWSLMLTFGIDFD